MIPRPPENICRVFRTPATSIARNRIKAAVAANIVMLGALHRVRALVNRKSLEKAIAEAMPKGKGQLNMDAFNLGFETVEEVQ